MQVPSVYRMLAIIRENPGSDYRTLAEKYGAAYGSASITKNLKKIRELGWASRPPYHKRGVYQITDKGLDVMACVDRMEALE